MRINRTRRSQGLPHLAQLVEHLTVVGKNNVSADIRVSPVQVREWGPTSLIIEFLNSGTKVKIDDNKQVMDRRRR